MLLLAVIIIGYYIITGSYYKNILARPIIAEIHLQVCLYCSHHDLRIKRMTFVQKLLLIKSYNNHVFVMHMSMPQAT